MFKIIGKSQASLIETYRIELLTVHIVKILVHQGLRPISCSLCFKPTLYTQVGKMILRKTFIKVSLGEI